MELDLRGVISRIDSDDLRALLGARATSLIGAIRPAALSPANIESVVFRLKSPEDLITEEDGRGLVFDALRTDEAIALCEALELKTRGKAPHTVLKEARFREGSGRLRALRRAFGLPSDSDSKGTAVHVVSAEPIYGLFEHQRRAVTALAVRLREPHSRALLHMPTGAGKTRVAMAVVAEHLVANGPTRVIWLAYSEELCEQAFAEFLRAWRHRGDRTLDVTRFWGAAPSSVQVGRDGVTIASVSKVHAAFGRDLREGLSLRDNASLVVFDEAHQAIAPTYRGVVEDLLDPRLGTRLLGLSATPGRSWDRIEEDEKLARFFHHSKVTLEVEGYRNPVDYLVAEGYLARPTFRRIEYRAAMGSRAEVPEISKWIDIPNDVLEHLAEDEARNLQIVARVLSLAQEHSRIILFAATVDHAEMLSTVIADQGLRALCISSRSSPAQRQRSIEAFKDPSLEPMVICNFGVLTTGFDAPQTSAAVIARPTKSLVLYSQMVGRALRGPRAGGNKHAVIETVIDPGLPGFGEIGEAFLNWEDVW